MKKNIWLSAAFIAILAVLYLSVRDRGSPSAIKIGILSPLTGNYAPLGEDFSAGARAAAMVYPHVELVEADTASDPKTAISAMNKLMQEGVPIFLTGPGSAVSLALAPIAEESRVILVAQSKTPKLNDAGRYNFRFSPLVDPEAITMARHMYGSGLRRAAVVYDASSDTLTAGKDAFVKEFTSLGGEAVSVEGFNPKLSQDFRTIILKSISSRPDSLYLVINENQTVPMIKQARALGLPVPLFGGLTQDTDRVSNNAGGDIEGMVITAEPIRCERDSLTKRYCSLYEAMSSSSPQYYGGYAYDAVKFVVDSVREGDDVDSIVERMNATRSFSGVMGTVGIDEQGNMSDKEFDLKIAKDGAFVVF